MNHDLNVRRNRDSKPDRGRRIERIRVALSLRKALGMFRLFSRHTDYDVLGVNSLLEEPIVEKGQYANAIFGKLGLFASLDLFCSWSVSPASLDSFRW